MMPSSHNSWTCSLFYPCCRGLPSNSLLANYDWMQNFTFKVSWLCWTNKLVIWCSSTKVCKSIKILWQEISSWNYFQKVILPVYIFSSSHFLVFNFDRRSCNKNILIGYSIIFGVSVSTEKQIQGTSCLRLRPRTILMKPPVRTNVQQPSVNLEQKIWKVRIPFSVCNFQSMKNHVELNTSWVKNKSAKRNWSVKILVIYTKFSHFLPTIFWKIINKRTFYFSNQVLFEIKIDG